MHRQLLTPPPGKCIDHANGNGLDNRRANLRFATPAQNAWNTRRKVSASGYKGVYFSKANKFGAAIRCNKKRIHLGCFDSPVDAAKAYDKAAKKYHGQFAQTNF
jgi:hypothetical protein